MKYDVIALGELLIDFTSYGESEQGNKLFEACPGGAVCNVLSILSKLGRKTAYIGKVGDDQFGRSLVETITEIGIDSSQVLFDKEVNTTLAFVHTFADGDRDFSFYRKPGADMMLKPDELDEGFIENTRIFHHGTLSMTHPEVRDATKKAIAIAKDFGALISFDPNLRPPLWSNLQLAKEQIHYGLSQCDILKIADNELQFITGIDNFEEGITLLKEKYNITLILLTLGKNGSRAYYKDLKVEKPGFSCDTIETTGAGDAFCGSVLDYLLSNDINSLTESQLLEMITFANGAAALVTTKAGALRIMPNRQNVLDFTTNLNF
jgi:fructokinase